jgi:hypothetical protein
MKDSARKPYIAYVYEVAPTKWRWQVRDQAGRVVAQDAKASDYGQAQREVNIWITRQAITEQMSRSLHQ